MNRRERIVIAMNLRAGLVYAVVWSGSNEIERLTLDLQMACNGRPGVVLSWVPLEFRPA